MPIAIQRVGVLGAGTMGSRIAAHCANAGVPVELLDVASTDGTDRDAIAKRGFETALRGSPPAFFTDQAQTRVRRGNFDDHLERLRACDWVIEAVSEDLGIKRKLWERAMGASGPQAIFSTNTSGILLGEISAGFSADTRRRFLGTHFFNPPRYLRLVELIVTPQTDPAIARLVTDFCEERLGKGVVLCKDTPGFVANRIGAFWVGTVCQLMQDGAWSIEEADALTGAVLGLPRTASFRLLDVIGLDVWLSIGKNLYEALPHDPWRERFQPAPFLQEMVRRGWLGDKSQGGFYRRAGAGRDLEVLDWRTLQYRPAEPVRLPALDSTRHIEAFETRLKALTQSEERDGQFLRQLLDDVFVYASACIPEISDSVVEIDRAMQWGYAHRYGPFQLWDLLGFQAVAQRLDASELGLPSTVSGMMRSGVPGFYRAADHDGEPLDDYFDLQAGRYHRVVPPPATLLLAGVKRARGVIKKLDSGCLVDLHDDVLCLEFAAELRELEAALSLTREALALAAHDFRALVLTSAHNLFLPGLPLGRLLSQIEASGWEAIDRMLVSLQQTNQALWQAPVPVVCAVSGRVSGEACELALHCQRVQASAEAYLGLPAIDLGLIPAGGACQQLLVRMGSAEAALSFLLSRKITGSAQESFDLGLLGAGDGLSMNPGRLLAEAKETALGLARNNTAIPAREVRPGERPTLPPGLTGHDYAVAEKLAHVLSGSSPQEVLDRERSAFLSLCGDPSTQDRLRQRSSHG